MKRDWNVRAYKKGDEDKIFDLVKVVYPEKKLNKENWMKFWKWMYTECPAGKASIWLADHNGKIAGQYPMIFANLKVGDKTAKVGQNIELMTHPDYRKQGMFLTLEKKALNEAAKEGTYITIGFPNEAAYPGHIKTGWFDIGSLDIGFKPFNLEKMIQSSLQKTFTKRLYITFGKVIIKLFYREKKTNFSDNIKISQITSFDNRIDKLWKEISDKYKITTIRNKDFLNWRYIKTPDVTYTIFIAEENDKLQGYIVVRCVDEKGVKIGYIYDIFTPKDRPEIAYALIKKSIEFFKSKNTDMALILMVADKDYCKLFRKKGFIFSKFIQSGFIEGGQFCAFSSHPNIPKSLLMKKENWYIQLGDSDTL